MKRTLVFLALTMFLNLVSDLIELPKNPDVPQWKAELVQETELEDIQTYATQMMYYNDNLYFSDVGQPAVVVFDLKGNYLKTIGRKGKGPGEFGRADYLWSESDKEFFSVFDGANRRISHFDFEGNFIDSETYDVNQNMYTTRLGSNDVSEIARMSFGKKMLRHTTVVLDTKPDAVELYHTASHPAMLGRYNFEKPYFATLDDKLFLTYVSTKDYNLKIFDNMGNLIREISKKCDRIPITGEELKEQKEVAEKLEIRMKKNLTIDKDVYGFENINNNIFSDREEFIWVSTTDFKGNFLDVYDFQGELVAQCRGAEDDYFIKAHIQDGFIYSLIYDNENEMYLLKKFRVVK